MSAPVEQKRLAEGAPVEARAFADEVFSAEGFESKTADRHLYRQVSEVVSKAFRESATAQERDPWRLADEAVDPAA